MKKKNNTRNKNRTISCLHSQITNLTDGNMKAAARASTAKAKNTKTSQKMRKSSKDMKTMKSLMKKSSEEIETLKTDSLEREQVAKTSSWQTIDHVEVKSKSDLRDQVKRVAKAAEKERGGISWKDKALERGNCKVKG